MTSAADTATTSTQRMLRDAEDVLFSIAYETAALLRAALESIEQTPTPRTG